MSNKDKASLAPKLRFPEFRGMKGWKGVPLSELVSTLDAGVSVNSGDRPATGNEIGILKTSAVTNGIFEPQENKVVFDEVERGRVKEQVQAGTIIISRMNTPALVGANAYVETSLENIYLPDRLWAAKSKPGTSMRFVAAILGSDKGRTALTKLAKGSSGSMKNITKPDVLAFLIEAPSPAEQQEIAECLSSLADLIAAQARKVDALKTQKKGLMLQLFPREGETQPRLRFPEFRKNGDWKARKIGDMLAETQRPMALLDDAEYRLVTVKRRYGGLISRGVMKGREILVKSQFMVATGDFLISKRQIVHDACGLVTQELNGFIVSNEYSVLTPKPVCSIEFFSWFAMQPVVSASFMNCSVGIVIEKMLFKLPAWLKQEFLFPSLPEQQRIADCLTSFDTLITAATQELETFKTHKKGLMQQLFPSAEAVEA